MKILFDQGVPVPLRKELPDLDVTTAYQMGWSHLSNGTLLATAEEAGFTIFVTTDKNLRYQQKLSERVIAIVVLPTTRWPEIKTRTPIILTAPKQTTPGTYQELTW